MGMLSFKIRGSILTCFHIVIVFEVSMELFYRVRDYKDQDVLVQGYF